MTLGKSLKSSKLQFINDNSSTWPYVVVMRIKGTNMYNMCSLSPGFNKSPINVREKKKMLQMVMLLMVTITWCLDCTKLQSTSMWLPRPTWITVRQGIGSTTLKCACW